jgi:hypothetical protein
MIICCIKVGEGCIEALRFVPNVCISLAGPEFILAVSISFFFFYTI